MTQLADFIVRFWGVRGSIACPGPETARYGGNTSCVEVRCGPTVLIFDAGTGVRDLGLALDAEAAGENRPTDAWLLFSHTHLDHIGGLPFFSSLYNQRNRFRLAAGHLRPERQLRDVLCYMMTPPLFPVPLDIFSADITYQDFTVGEVLEPSEDVRIKTGSLNHPNGATGYRVEYDGRAVSYVTDTEHVPGRLDESVLDLIRGSDIFIYDATYDESEFASHIGWGHSTWQEGARLAEAADVGTYVIFHHDPGHDDAFMDRVAAEAEILRPGTLVAREGMVLHP